MNFIPLIMAFVIFGSALTLTLDELYDGRTSPEHGIKWRDIGKKSHESVIIAQIILGIVSLLLYL